MKKPRLYKWKICDETEGLLFFAQCVEELLFHHTLDSFKSPALNTHLNVLELNFLASELFDKKIKPGALVPVLEELEKRIKNDPVVEDRKNIYLEYHKKISDSIKHPDEFYFSVQALLLDIKSNYWDNLKGKIINAVKNQEEKRRILSLASSLTSEMELQGYNKHFLYFMAFNFFFNGRMPPQTIDENTKVSEFLNLFNGEIYKWQVVFRGTASFLQFEKHLNGLNIQVADKLPSSFLYAPSQKIYLGEDESYPSYIILNQSAKDRFQARDFANKRVDYVCDIFRFHDHGIEIRWRSNCVVRKDSETQFVSVKPPPEPMVRGMAPRIMSIETIGQTIDIMKGKHFDEHSNYIFRKALDYHRAAAETVASENQLVSLWAALEGFLPSPKEDDGASRIEQLLSSLLPALTLSYAEKIFRYTATCLKFSGKETQQLIESINGKQNFFESTILVLTTDELDEVRSCLYEILRSHPLLRYRCHWCHESFKSNKSIKETLLKHRKKVSWHIQRIYTTRNQIVHSAQSLPYITTLIENLHSYFDILLNSVMKVGLKSGRTININTVLKILEVNEKSYLKELEGQKEYISLSNYQTAIFGTQNPLNPLL